MEETILKQRLKLNSFYTCSSFGVNGALDLCDGWPLALTGHIINDPLNNELESC